MLRSVSTSSGEATVQPLSLEVPTPYECPSVSKASDATWPPAQIPAVSPVSPHPSRTGPPVGAPATVTVRSFCGAVAKGSGGLSYAVMYTQVLSGVR